MNKVYDDAAAAVADVPDGATVMIGGFGDPGSPTELIHALIDQGAGGLTVVNNNAGNGLVGLIRAGRVRKMICSYPRSAQSVVFADLFRVGEIELELVPQGTLAERIRAAGAGIPAFYTPTAAGTPLAEGKETRQFEGRGYIMEQALHADYALVKAACADTFGNLTYNKSARNFAPVMCMAATTSVVQARRTVAPGDIDPERVVTPGIFVDRIVEVAEPVREGALIDRGATYP